jgi:hypothetical protein
MQLLPTILSQEAEINIGNVSQPFFGEVVLSGPTQPFFADSKLVKMPWLVLDP